MCACAYVCVCVYTCESVSSVLQIQCSDLTAERHRLQEQLKMLVEQQQRAASSFQHRLSTLQEESSVAKVPPISSRPQIHTHMHNTTPSHATHNPT